MQARMLGGCVRLVSCAGLVFSLISVATAVAVAAEPVERFGTAIFWAKDAAAATSEATRQGKVVFVMHVSGNFRKLTFT